MPKVPNRSGCNGGKPGLAKNIPTTAVKIISATTLGLQRAK